MNAKGIKDFLGKIPVIGEIIVLRRSCKLLRQIEANMAYPHICSVFSTRIKQMVADETIEYIRGKNSNILVFESLQRFFDYLDCKLVDIGNKSGLFMEFGVHTGIGINRFSKALGTVQFYGFDSFEGLPEDWDALPRKFFDLKGELPKVNSNVTLVKGYFDQTLPEFVNQTLPEFVKHHKEKASFIAIDCDLYQSTKTVFDVLEDRIEKGTLIYFDEYFGYLNWREHEFKAFQEFIARTGLKYKYLAVSGLQALVEIL